MRPYQIADRTCILSRIEISTNYKKLGTIDAGGYIWHTTGSGKTLTSFKTAQLATSLEYIDKVLFVWIVKTWIIKPRKSMTVLKKVSANSNTSTIVLKRQLENDNANIIITTIQKLDTFIGK